MPRGNRRHFLKCTGLGAATLAAEMSARNLFAAQPRPGPDHRSLSLPGVHAYANKESVLAGESISFYVSSSVPYRLSVCRLGEQVDDPAGDEVLHCFPKSGPKVQPIYPGSYVRVDKGIEIRLKALTLECWVRPWKTDAPAGLIEQFSPKSAKGYALLLNPHGGVSFVLGGETKGTASLVSSMPLKPRQWHHVIGTWNGAEMRLWINGAAAGLQDGPPVIDPRGLTLRLGASADHALVAHFLDGDLAMPIIYSSALSAGDVQRRYEDGAATAARGPHVLGCWPLLEERGATLQDVSRFRRRGRIINHGTWMIGGPLFEANVPRFGNYDPDTDTRRGHALRFASDDLYDCQWRVTHRFRVPFAAASGIYVGRLEYEWEGQRCWTHVTFIVRRPKRRLRPALLVLAATNTWRAYNAAAFPKPKAGLKHVCGTNGLPNSPGAPPAFSFYRGHVAGQGTYQMGLRMPWPAAGPYLLYGGPTDYSHLMRAERFTHAWLHRAGYKFDVIADSDLDRDPDQLRRYRAFLINGHSEYWSLPMYEALRKYLDGGGNAIVLSGNSLFWRVSYNDDRTILECRKVDAPGEQMPAARRGECWHSHDGLRGGLLRECGFPGWKLIGLETLGWNNPSDGDQFGPYVVDAQDHFLFHQPHQCGLKADEPFGVGPQGGLPRANGHEIDVRLSTLEALRQLPPPQGAHMPPDPAGMVRLANGIIPWKRDAAVFDYFFRSVKPAGDQGGEMIYWERPEGGRVFNAGSIGSGWALHADPRLQTLLRNVLHHFGVEA